MLSQQALSRIHGELHRSEIVLFIVVLLVYMTLGYTPYITKTLRCLFLVFFPAA